MAAAKKKTTKKKPYGKHAPVAPFTYDLSASREYCESIGLHWLGDEFLDNIIEEAKELLFTQAQFDAAMRQHLWHVRWLFDPHTYKFSGRVMLAFYFLTGWKPKK